MNILKFGGTSMADESTWQKVLEIIKSTEKPAVVVSATSQTTNALIKSAEQAKNGDIDKAKEISRGIAERHKTLVANFLQQNDIKSPNTQKECDNYVDELIHHLNNFLMGIYTLGELTPKSMDTVSSIGERLSSYLLSECGNALGLNTFFVDSRTLLKTDSVFGRAKPDMEKISKAAEPLKDQISKSRIPIIGGFYGSNDKGEITTLGRGGSDYSASLFGLVLDANAIQIWTDVSGMFTSDPRFIEGTQPIPEIGFNEAAELAYFGARVLHPATIQPAVEKNIPVFVKNTFEPDKPGTRIVSDNKNSTAIRAIAFKKNIHIITISSSRMLMAYGFLSRVFDIFEQFHVSVDVVTTSEVSISMTVDSEDYLEEIINELSKTGEVNVTQNQGLVSVVGQNFLEATGIAAKTFSALDNIPIRMISQGSSNNNITLVVDNDDVIDAAQALHNSFFN